MRIALAQILAGTDPAANLSLVAEYTRRAAEAGARLVVFPEGTMSRFGVPLAPVAEAIDGPWADGVRGIAARAGITVVAGMFTPTPDGRVTNTLLATGPDVEAHYDKIHLYDAFGFAESDAVAPGRQPVVVTVDGVGVNMPATTVIPARAAMPRTPSAQGPSMASATGASGTPNRDIVPSGNTTSRAPASAARRV